MYKYIIGLVLIALAYGLGRYATPEKIKIKTVTKVETKIQEKIRVKTIIRQKPNGEKITEITYQNDKETKNAHVEVRSKEIKNVKPQWSVGITNDYKVSIDRRLIGSLFIGAQTNLIDTKVYLRYEF